MGCKVLQRLDQCNLVMVMTLMAKMTMTLMALVTMLSNATCFARRSCDSSLGWIKLSTSSTEASFTFFQKMIFWKCFNLLIYWLTSINKYQNVQ